jgi:Ca2+-binding EF-hand superfamily protein
MRVKKRLASKGTKGYLVFEKTLKHADSDHDGLVSIDEFKKVIYDLKIDITPT